MIKAVVLAGGSGSRLWPLSRKAHPKQFLSLHGEKTMLQSIVQRLESLDIQSLLTICNVEHRFLVAEQLRDIDRLGSIILEPVARNTAPALALAALTEVNSGADPLLLVLAADHVIENKEAFSGAIAKAIPLANQGKLVTFGVVPHRPNVGYGYIKIGEKLDDGFSVERFVEKPCREDAEKYVASAEYLWNSGMFLFKASRYIEELTEFHPQIVEHCRAALSGALIDLDFLRIDQQWFSRCESVSIDYAVMERTEAAAVVPMDAGWSDVGTWSSLKEISQKDDSGNVLLGDVITNKLTNSYVRSEQKLVAVMGLDDVIIVDTKDATLVSHQSELDNLKLLLQNLEQGGRQELEVHAEVYRPWGKYETVDRGTGYQVKRITVKPGGKLSLQKHHQRSEHWVVVSGKATVIRDDAQFTLAKNESTYIPIDTIHSLENNEDELLEIIEVQSGDYLGEDDIVRYRDHYGRT